MMASAIIHIAVASEVNKKLKHNNDEILIGSIAPDISKFLGQTKVKSHFLDDVDTNIPNIEKFLIKYNNKMYDDFVLGYFIHLYTDYLWFKYFIPEIYQNDCITKLDGTIVKCDEDMLIRYIYNDYTNLNIKLLDEYHLDLKIFYNNPPKLSNIIQEIPMEKIYLLLDQISIIIENSKINKDLVFNIENIKVFIQTSTELILSKLKELGKA